MFGSKKPGEGLPMSSNIAISINNISKIYQIYDRPQDRLKQSIWRGRKQFYREFWALKDISFNVKKGETLGIIGRNGSGKSTLLQIIAGTLKPTSGEVRVNGRVAALLELGSGFNPDFTGRENVFLNGAILGISRDEMERRFGEIADFADIGDFIDQPVKTYSSGMYVRLAFAVAISVDPDILIVDEALSVGDGRFQLKCFEKIKALKESGTTILLVSHDLQSIRQFCDSAVLVDKGVLLEVGIPNVIVNHYTKLLFSSEERELIEVQNDKKVTEFRGANSNKDEKEYRYGNLNGVIEDVGVLDSQGNSTLVVTTCDEVTVKMIVEAKKQIEKPIYAMTIKTIKGLEIYGTNTFLQGLPFQALNSGDRVEIRFKQQIALLPGDYYISLGFVELVNEDIVPLDRRYDVLEIKVLPKGYDRSFGLANLESLINVNLIQKDINSFQLQANEGYICPGN